MRLMPRFVTAFVTALLVSASASAQTRAGVMGDLLKDIDEVESKMVGLAKAMPDAAWTWRPSDGARSTGEVLLHVATDNYYMPTAMGIAAPAETGITKVYKTAATFEKKTMSRAQVMAELQKSFAFLKKSMADMPDAKINEAVEIFGQKNTNRGVWVMATTHLHEHLGQLIAYARSNKVVPPWSK